MDEHILEARRNLVPHRSARTRERSGGLFQASAVRPGDAQRRSEHRCGFDTRQSAQLAGGKVEVGRAPKLEVARELIALIAKRLPPPSGAPRRGARKRRLTAATPRNRLHSRRTRR